MKPGVEALQAVPFLASCPQSVLTRLDTVSDLARLGPDEALFQEGDPVRELNILLSGYAVTVQSQPDGNEAVLDVVEPIGLVGLPEVILGNAPTHSARTVTSARIIVIAAAELRTLLRRAPALEAALLSQALAEIQELNAQNTRLKLQSAAQRLAGYLLTLITEPDVRPARFVLPFEKRWLAAKLGCSQENLSRAFASLRSLGVTTQGTVVIVRSSQELQRYADRR
jgi:CRP-like cAMP-binding protein